LFTRSGSSFIVALALALAFVQSKPALSKDAVVASVREEQVCDPLADYYLGMEDYPAAIRRHEIVIREHPANALAHYHLGFAYGMTGNHSRELSEYHKAIELGLSDWELFLNLGLLELEDGNFASASEVLQLAELLAPYRPEPHFNLGLVYERLRMYQKARQEILLSLRLDPNQPDARNTLALLYADEGNYRRADQEWSDLLASNPNYTTARANLAILKRVERGEIKLPDGLGGMTHVP
jgi:tetratricopeptide (TPR) repeat protein